jgi:O-antigen/teichoic acid export membrane protein
LVANLAILARIFTPQDFGVYSTAWTTINVFLTFSLFGLHTATAKIVSESLVRDRRTVGTVFFNAMMLSALLGIILFFLGIGAAPFAESFVRTPGFSAVVRVIAWNIPLLNVTMVAQSMLQGMHEFSWYGAMAAVPGLLTVPVTYASAVGAGLSGALWAIAAVNTASLMMSVFLASRALRNHGIHIRCKLEVPILKRLLSLSVPLFLCGILVLPSWWVANLYLARTHGFSAVGLFVPAFMFFQWLQFLPSALNVPALSLLTRSMAEGNERGFDTLLNNNFRAVTFMTMPVVLTIWVFHASILNCAFGARFVGASEALGWMGWAGLLSASSLVFASALISSGRAWMALRINACWLFIFLSLTAALVFSEGANGLAKAAFLSYVLYSLIVWYVVARSSVPASLLLRLVAFAALFVIGLPGLVSQRSNLTCSETVVLAGGTVAATFLAALFAIFSWQEIREYAALIHRVGLKVAQLNR